MGDESGRRCLMGGVRIRGGEPSQNAPLFRAAQPAERSQTAQGRPVLSRRALNGWRPAAPPPWPRSHRSASAPPGAGRDAQRSAHFPSQPRFPLLPQAAAIFSVPPVEGVLRPRGRRGSHLSWRTLPAESLRGTCLRGVLISL